MSGRPQLSDELLDDLMAIEERISAAPRRRPATGDGCIYVIQFGSGVVKVGKTVNSSSRLATHAKHAKVHGDRIAQTWTSERHQGYSSSEQELIRFCDNQGRRLAREYFTDLSFSTARFFGQWLVLNARRAAYLARLVDAARGDMSVTWAEAHRLSEAS